MKLSTISENKLPGDLRSLAKDYWDIRNQVITGNRDIEPYICLSVSLGIKDYLESKGHKVNIVRAKSDYHFFLEVDDRYVVDGSDYQFYYDKSISSQLPSRVADVLVRNNITTIGSVIALVDHSAGHALSWTDVGSWNPNTDVEAHENALKELRPNDLEIIKGRLLPILLKIQPIEKWDREYEPADQLDFE
jgi:hypothetical protein